MGDFDSLTLALEGWFRTRLHDLPAALRSRVETEFSPMSWDELSPEQRREVALQWDYQRDPSTQRDRRFWFDFFQKEENIREQIAQWSAVSTPTAADLASKETRLAELGQDLEHLSRRFRHKRIHEYSPSGTTSGDGVPVRYIPFPTAMKTLGERLGATPEELAAWVWVGSEDGGLAAYTNVNESNELNPPLRFHFHYEQGTDYLAPLTGLWFRECDISSFQPRDRFITGAALVRRWRKPIGIHVDAYIRANILESRLVDMHPILGLTQWSEEGDLPPKETALFVLAHVEGIERNGIPSDWRNQSAATAAQPDRQAKRNAEIRAKYEELAGKGRRNYVKEIQRTVPGAESLSARRIRDIARGR